MSGLRSLLDAELRRFFARAVVRGTFAFGMLLATVVLVVLFVRSDVRVETRSFQAPHVECPPGVTTAPPSSNSVNVPLGCTINGTLTETARLSHDHRLRVGRNFAETTKGVGIAMMLVSFVLGATFIGAEFGAGSLSTQLLFEPRRWLVALAKALAVALGVALLAATMLVYIGVLQWLGSQLRGVVSGLDAQWFAARIGDIARVCAGVACGAVAAFAVTLVARHTVAAVAGLLFVAYGGLIVAGIGHWHALSKANPVSCFTAVIIDLNGRSAGNAGRFYFTVGPALLASAIWIALLVGFATANFTRREVR